MKEQYVPIEPIKKGVEVTSFAGKVVYEAIKPRVEKRMARSVAELLALLSGERG